MNFHWNFCTYPIETKKFLEKFRFRIFPQIQNNCEKNAQENSEAS